MFADGPNVQISKTGHHIGGWDLYFKIKICPTLKLSPIACNVSRENVILWLGERKECSSRKANSYDIFILLLIELYSPLLFYSLRIIVLYNSKKKS